MDLEKQNPGALAGAHRADVKTLAGNYDIDIGTGTAFDLQVRRILARYAVSLPVAIVVAEIAFSPGRRA